MDLTCLYGPVESNKFEFFFMSDCLTSCFQVINNNILYQHVMGACSGKGWIFETVRGDGHLYFIFGTNFSAVPGILEQRRHFFWNGEVLTDHLPNNSLL